ncbi:hypothetical protein O6H91_03G128400 [Diphasiastrum complanatum]|uniref:Uncharacterized protein n=1 Tax=Diphasiastrum complanatum TaxID=34168 RepID=A0ACC2EBL1_DIPCM|nr:hypothetical protein O6H91_03G128400 [Diphasiastrum complanatum]
MDYASAAANSEDLCMWEPVAGAPPATQTPLESFLTDLQSAALASFGERDFDPKLYVDLPLRSALSVTRTAFEALPRLCSGKIASDTLKHFIDKFFDVPGSDLLPHVPKDFRSEPEGFLPLVKSQEARVWALKVHALWLQLSRKVAENVQNQPDMHTLLPLPYPVIVPGSRFREVYYWDSYWIIRGLAVSKMYDTAKGIVRNLFSLVQTYGFVPNGARTYYKNRSQPPLLSAMVRVVYENTHDLDFVEEAFPVLLREHSFWQSDLHRVHIMDRKGHKHSLNRYSANWIGPRPESSTIDKQIADRLSKEKRSLLYHDIASAAESGWDFSSRNGHDLSSMRTSSIVPVDLNAFLFQKFHVLDIVNQNVNVFPSNFIPLWCGVLRPGDSRIENIVKAFSSSGLLYSAGVPSSLRQTGQQWDFPNAWAPLQHMIIEGLDWTNSKDAQIIAEVIARRWIWTNYNSFNATGEMQEKLDAQICGKVGYGGEYKPQAGFGWSNGVVLALLQKYGWPEDPTLTCR